ncbi:ABC-type spermidine/putrescine transport system, ATPase component [Thiocystis violascens DSM 198]|uniref:ABC-type spermidine/putrescine transport system, ATPase component n=1 Tax=Thiocystis violascens (strain ATCC 17096 / DSM 198 / 6111) TaxID=765911 RepID=I3Y8N4_THIV6|nr:ABC-type spermidine/putrescine transport system, ATPase component [Thiocystis violascens DSM 198]
MSNPLELHHVSVAYDGPPVVRDISLTLEPGAIGCLIGPSGCGKSTLLRAIAGFEPLRRGEIRLAEQRVAAVGHSLPPESRRVGMVFQDFALFPHLSVVGNLAFGIRRLPRRARRARVESLLELVGLADAAALYPHQLSGGMQQRVALARALAPGPAVLLLDEPFSSMDATLREQLAREVREVLRREGVTAILVTHDQIETFAMADRIGVLADGGLRQWDSALGLYL